MAAGVLIGFTRWLGSVFLLLGRGLLLGIGFTVGFLIVYALAMPTVSSSVEVRARSAKAEAENFADDLVVSDIVERRFGVGYAAVLGKLTNRGSLTTAGVTIQVRFWQGDTLVDHCDAREDGVQRPGESQYFKLFCGSENDPIPAHDRIDVVVLDSYW